jgi:hypothetical protein
MSASLEDTSAHTTEGRTTRGQTRPEQRLYIRSVTTSWRYASIFCRTNRDGRLKVDTKVDHANVESGLIRPIDDAGDSNRILITTDRSRLIENRLVRQIQADRFRSQYSSFSTATLDQT